MYVVPATAAHQVQRPPAAVKKVAPPNVLRIPPEAAIIHGFGMPLGVASMMVPMDRNEDFAELIEAAKATIEGHRDDGPALGFVFDRPPCLVTGIKRKNDGDYGIGEFNPLSGKVCS